MGALQTLARATHGTKTVSGGSQGVVAVNRARDLTEARSSRDDQSISTYTNLC